MPLIDDVRVHSHAANVTKSRSLMRSTGWEVIGGSNTGLSLGDVLKVGGGYANLQVRKIGMPFCYVVTGGYVELGAGLGVEVKAELFGKAAARLWKIVGAGSTDAIGLPSGGLSPLYFGPSWNQPSIGHADFEGSTWLYLNAAGTMGAIGADTGFLFLIDPAAFADAFRSGGNRKLQGQDLDGALFVGCIAWCIYAGSGLAIGLGVGAGARLIKTISFKAELSS